MSKKFINGNIIAICIWIFFLVFQLVEKYSLNQVIYVQAEILAIIIFVDLYILGLEKYRSIPEKTVTANFIKEYRSAGHESADASYDELERGWAGVYQYELNGRKYKYKIWKRYGAFSDNITLYYRKGKSDITCNPEDLKTYPHFEAIWRIFLIMPGSGLIVVTILHFILKIPIDF